MVCRSDSIVKRLVEAVGSPGEVLRVGFVSPAGELLVGECAFDETTHLKVSPDGCFADS